MLKEKNIDKICIFFYMIFYQIEGRKDMDRIQANKMFERAMKAVKAEVGNDFAIKLTEKRLGDGSISFNMKIEQVVIDGRNKADILKEQWENNCDSLGVPKDWFGKSILVGRTIYTIYSLLPERPKNFICIRNSKGKEFITNVNQVKNSLEGKLF